MTTVNKTIRILSLFSGIGAFEETLRKLNIKHEIVYFSEINKSAIKSYCILNNISEDKNLGDIRNINIDLLSNNIDLLTFGFPCQDISLLGKKEGFDNNQTRSGLVWEVLKIINKVKPKFAIFENVKNILSKKFKPQFDLLVEEFEKLGYRVEYRLLNAKDYGVPQNRERIIGVLIREDIKIDKIFSEGFPLTLTVYDLMEENISEKYYISKKLYNYIFDLENKLVNTTWANRKKHFILNKEIAMTLLTYKKPTNERAMQGRLYCEEIKEKNVYINKKGNEQILENIKQYKYKIRALTPLEYFRLMSFSDESFYKIKKLNISDAQLYKMSGNSIVINILIPIFKNLFNVPRETLKEEN